MSSPTTKAASTVTPSMGPIVFFRRTFFSSGRASRKPPARCRGFCRRCRSPRKSSQPRCVAHGWKTYSASAGAEKTYRARRSRSSTSSRMRVLLGTLGGREGVADRGVEENEEPRDHPRRSEQRSSLLRAVRPARWFVQPRRLRRGGHNLQHHCVTTVVRKTRARRCCSQAHSRLRPDTCCTARPQCSCSRWDKASTCSCSIASIGAFMLVERGLRTPKTHKSYSVNEGNRRTFPRAIRNISTGRRSRTTPAVTWARWWPTFTGILLKGGVFMYPPTKKAPNGKLRLMYEANPMAMIIGAGRQQGTGRTRTAHSGCRAYRYSSASTGDPGECVMRWIWSPPSCEDRRPSIAGRLRGPPPPPPPQNSFGPSSFSGCRQCCRYPLGGPHDHPPGTSQDDVQL